MPAVPSYVPDSPPAKLWELLRRNRRFRRTVARMKQVRDQCQNCSGEQRRKAVESGRRILDSVPLQGNAFAHIALQWLVPQPLFEVHHIVDAAPIPNPLAKRISHRSIKIGRGLTPNPNDPGWCWFEDNPNRGSTAERRAQFDSPPLRWGPQIITKTSDDERLKGHLDDEITEWREWFSSHRFTVDTPWRDSPPGFQWRWEGLWNKLTGTHKAAFETNFFQGWSLSGLVERSQGRIKAANQCIRDLTDDLDNVREGRPEEVCPPVPTRGGNSLREIPQITLPLSEVEKTRMVQFSMFAGQRVFVLPRLTSKQAAAEILKRLASELSDKLPKTRELLGTQRAWNVFLEFEPFRGPTSKSLGTEIGEFFRAKALPGALKSAGIPASDASRWVENGRLKRHTPGTPASQRRVLQKIERFQNQDATRNRQCNRHFERWVALIERLAEATFPALNHEILEEKSPS